MIKKRRKKIRRDYTIPATRCTFEELRAAKKMADKDANGNLSELVRLKLFGNKLV